VITLTVREKKLQFTLPHFPMTSVKTGPKVWQYKGQLPYDLRRSAVRNLSRAGRKR
jgi:hypothetical protein